MKLRDWLRERELNARRIASGKSGVDRAGWLEDADYFKRAAEAVDELARQKAAGGVSVPAPALPSDEDLHALAMASCGVMHGDVLHMGRKQTVAFARKVLAAFGVQGCGEPSRTDLEWFRLPEIFGKFVDYAERPDDANALRIIRACAERFGAGVSGTAEPSSKEADRG